MKSLRNNADCHLFRSRATCDLTQTLFNMNRVETCMIYVGALQKS